MGLDERALGSTAATIAYGLTGVLSLIPAIQEISLERKLNEDKTKLEKNAFHPDLVPIVFCMSKSPPRAD